MSERPTSHGVWPTTMKLVCSTSRSKRCIKLPQKEPNHAKPLIIMFLLLYSYCYIFNSNYTIYLFCSFFNFQVLQPIHVSGYHPNDLEWHHFRTHRHRLRQSHLLSGDCSLATLLLSHTVEVCGPSYPDTLPEVKFTAGINMTCVEPDGKVKPTWGVLGRREVLFTP